MRNEEVKLMELSIVTNPAVMAAEHYLNSLVTFTIVTGHEIPLA